MVIFSCEVCDKCFVHRGGVATLCANEVGYNEL